MSSEQMHQRPMLLLSKDLSSQKRFKKRRHVFLPKNI
jgi:hypothetical protein